MRHILYEKTPGHRFDVKKLNGEIMLFNNKELVKEYNFVISKTLRDIKNIIDHMIEDLLEGIQYTFVYASDAVIDQYKNIPEKRLILISYKKPGESEVTSNKKLTELSKHLNTGVINIIHKTNDNVINLPDTTTTKYINKLAYYTKNKKNNRIYSFKEEKLIFYLINDFVETNFIYFPSCLDYDKTFYFFKLFLDEHKDNFVDLNFDNFYINNDLHLDFDKFKIFRNDIEKLDKDDLFIFQIFIKQIFKMYDKNKDIKKQS